MLKVVIIDDEPVIVEGLIRTIEWEKRGCKVVGFAYDGAEGISLIQKQQPDIIFSDISMPKIDGLTMIAGVKSQFPNTYITILTGYRDFDYAQKAISLGVSRFLLKPSKMDELEEALSFMVHELNKNKIDEMQDIEESTTDELTMEENDASSFVVRNAKKYIEENYMKKLTLSDVADHIYVSQWHLSKLLNKYCGKNFSEILNTIRINEAKKLLENPSYRIGDITEMVGFTDIAHFSRVFKKIEGKSPNEYRNLI